MTAPAGLVGDIGGTHARFALAVKGRGRSQIRDAKTLDNSGHASIEAAIEAYLKDVGGERPERAVLAVAGPITDGAVHFTNCDWTVSETRLRSEGGFAMARLINDFAAQALGAPSVSADQIRPLGPSMPGQADAVIAVLGPGTGFGLAGLVRQGERQRVLPTEGGHAGFAPVDEVEVQIWRFLQGRHGRVSIERICSGQGLYDLYLALAGIEGVKLGCADEREVQAASRPGGEALAAKAVDRFCRILGSAAGDIALTLGARGGVYVTGGVAQRLADPLASGGFRQRFEDKGRFRAYLAAIPTSLILEPYAALIGAASVLDEDQLG